MLADASVHFIEAFATAWVSIEIQASGCNRRGLLGVGAAPSALGGHPAKLELTVDIGFYYW